MLETLEELLEAPRPPVSRRALTSRYLYVLREKGRWIVRDPGMARCTCHSELLAAEKVDELLKSQGRPSVNFTQLRLDALKIVKRRLKGTNPPRSIDVIFRHMILPSAD